MQVIIQQLGTFLLSAIPTILLFTVLVLAYQFLVQAPLTATLQERHARTEGAEEKARQAIAQAEDLATDAALDAARKVAGQKVSQANAALEAEAAQARLAIQASAGDLARQVARAVLPVAAGGSR